MVSTKSFIAAFAALAVAPLAAAGNCTFDSSKPFTLHTEVVKGPEDFNNFFLTAFHVGASRQTVVGTRNASRSIGWVISNTSDLQQPIGNLPPFNLTLLDQAPTMSSAPDGYDYIDLSYRGSTPGFSFLPSNKSTAVLEYNTPSNKTSDFVTFALCHVNGTAPYFTVGPQYQLLWRSVVAAETDYESCADVELVAHNIE
ncbi:hypothetical protein AAFC00_000892 [Neodothiora populina]|uniref:DUF7907 domain-containing protein n=1 Tax=Neodothiora populina TaxID=2781224 RepID=A0ABR3PM53_9PEZI